MVTPHFEICRVADTKRIVHTAGSLKSKARIIIDGSFLSRSSTMCPRSGDNEEDTEQEDAVTWTDLINTIHGLQLRQFLDSSQTKKWLEQNETIENGRSAQIDEKKMHIVSLRLKTWSWDLMPHDIVRPLASTTLGTIIVVAHRMGMTWKEVRPSEGRLRAEGFGQSFSATLIRGLGIVLEYAREPGLVPRDTEILLWSLRVPSFDADKVGLALFN